MDIFFTTFQVALDVLVIITLTAIILRKNSNTQKSFLDVETILEAIKEEVRSTLKRAEARAEAIEIELEKLASKMKELAELVEKKKEEIETKKTASIVNTKDELTKQKKRELAKLMLRQNKSCEEVAKELELPLSEIKLIKSILEKESLRENLRK